MIKFHKTIRLKHATNVLLDAYAFLVEHRVRNLVRALRESCAGFLIRLSGGLAVLVVAAREHLCSPLSFTFAP